MLTPAQLQTLKTDILAGDAAQMFTDGNLPGVADAYNLDASPAFVVWRTSVTQDEIMQNGFDWVRVDNLTVGKSRIWEWMFNNAFRTINPSKSNVRLGIDETWKGTQADLDVRAAVYVHCKRNASRMEKLFTTGTGTTVSPATMGAEGPLAWQELVGL